MNPAMLPREIYSNFFTRDTSKKAMTTRIVVMIMVIVGIVSLLFFRRWVGVNPLKEYPMDSPSDITMDNKGNIYLISDSTTGILKIGPNGKLRDRIGENEHEFYSLSQICVGGDDRVYVHDVEVAGGVEIANERIYSLTENFVDPICEMEFEDRKGTVKKTVVGMSPYEDNVCVIREEGDCLNLYDGHGGPIFSYPFKNVDDTVLFATLGSSADDIFYVTYDGEVRYYIEDLEDEVLYDSDDVEGSVPQRIAYSDGMLYVSDLGCRDMIVIDTVTGEVDRIGDEGEKKDRSIFVNVDAKERLLSTTESALLLWDGESYEEVSSLKFATAPMIVICYLWFCVFVTVVLTISILVALMAWLYRRSNTYVRITIGIIAGVLLLVALFMGTLVPEFQKQMQDQVYGMELLVASAVQEQLPKEAFLELDRPSDYMSDDYKAVRQAVRSVIPMDEGVSSSLYCTCYRVIDDTITLTYTIEDVCVVYPYDWEYEGTGMQQVLEEGTPQTYTSGSSTGSFMFVHYPIHYKGDIIGFVEVGTDMNSIRANNMKIFKSLLFSVIAMTIVVILIVLELMYYFSGKRAYLKEKKESKEKVLLPPEIFRFIVFLIFLFTNITVAILPLQAVKLSEAHTILGLSPRLVASIPISAEVFSGAIFSALGGWVIKKLGAKKAILVSSLLFSVGLVLRGVPLFSVMTLGSLLNGAGWGVLLILVNIQIAELPEEIKDKGYAYYSISSISGINCGAVIGGFLVQWLSYNTLFIATGVTSIVLYFVCRKYLADNMPDETEEVATEAEGDATQQGVLGILRFVLRPRILGFFLLMLIPLLICGYFLNYLFPIVGTDWGLTETNVGYVLMLSGISSVAIGSPLTELFTKRNLRHFGLLASALLYAEAFLAIAFLQTVPVLVIAIILIGVANSFGIPLLTSYFTDLKEVERFGYDRAFGIYSLFENGAQSIASPILGLVFVVGLQRGFFLTAVITAVLALLFFLVAAVGAKKDKKMAKKAPEVTQ